MEKEKDIGILRSNGGESIISSGEEKNLADIIYIFYDKNELGIRMTDLSSTVRNEGIYLNGKILVNPSTIETVNWNENINYPNRSVDENYRDLSGIKKRKITTIMVSKQKMKEILDAIDKGVHLSKILIDISEKIIYNNDNQINTLKNLNDDNYFIDSYDDNNNFSK